jgi:hypothetical protein
MTRNAARVSLALAFLHPAAQLSGGSWTFAALESVIGFAARLPSISRSPCAFLVLGLSGEFFRSVPIYAKGKSMEFQIGNPEPGLFYISLVTEAQKKLPRNNVELTKTLQYRRISGPFVSEQDAKQEELKLQRENSRLESYIWQCQRRESPAMA